MDYHPSSYLSVNLYFAGTLQLRSIRPLYSSHGEHEKYKLNQKEPFLNTESKVLCMQENSKAVDLRWNLGLYL